MSSYGDRKRKAASVSKDETDTSPRLKAPPPHGGREHGAPGLLDLPAGVVAKVAQFLPIIGRQLDSTDCSLMSLSLVSGRQISQIIRQEYLRNNLDYLNYFLMVHVQMFQEEKLRKLSASTREEILDSLVLMKEASEQWMEMNEWWKDASRDAVTVGQGVEIVTNHPPICKTIVLPDFANDRERQQFDEAISFGPSAMVDICTEEAPIGEIYTVILAVDGVVLKGMDDDQVAELLLKEGSKSLRVLHSDFATTFFSPNMAIDLGLLEVLKYQIEELKPDVNCQDYCGLFFDAPSFENPINRRMPLILHALVQPDRQFLAYLLSVESFEVNPLMERDLDGIDILEKEHTLFHELSQIVLHKSLPGEIDLDQIDFILDQKAVNLEVQNARRLSPLEVLCAASNRKARELDLAKIFLSHGAEITDFALNFTAQNERNLFHLLHLYNAARRSIRTMGDFRDGD